MRLSADVIETMFYSSRANLGDENNTLFYDNHKLRSTALRYWECESFAELRNRAEAVYTPYNMALAYFEDYGNFTPGLAEELAENLKENFSISETRMEEMLDFSHLSLYGVYENLEYVMRALGLEKIFKGLTEIDGVVDYEYGLSVLHHTAKNRPDDRIVVSLRMAPDSYYQLKADNSKTVGLSGGYLHVNFEGVRSTLLPCNVFPEELKDGLIWTSIEPPILSRDEMINTYTVHEPDKEILLVNGARCLNLKIELEMALKKAKREGRI